MDDAWLRQAEAEHRIANSFQIAAAALAQERREITDIESAKAALAAMAVRLVAMARLHRTLAEITPEREVEIGRYLGRLHAELEDCVGTQLRVDADGCTLPALSAAKVGIIVSEMATNAAKHAMRDGGGSPVLTVEADRNGLGEVRLRIYDDGPGFPDGFDLATARSIGFTIIRSTVERLGGHAYVMPRFGRYLCRGAGLEIVLPPQRPQLAVA